MSHVQSNKSLEPDLRNIPDELKELPQWVCWKAVPDTDKDGNPKPRKCPVNPKTGEDAKANDPSTWGTYDQALEFLMRWKGKEHTSGGKTGPVRGIGFEFHANDPYVGVDLDKCCNGHGPEPWAMEHVKELGSYTEFSPSGTGFHIIIRGQLPPGGRKKGQIEAYQDGRFFTFTGRLLSPELSKIEERAEELKKFHSKVFLNNGTKPQNRASESTKQGETTN